MITLKKLSDPGWLAAALLAWFCAGSHADTEPQSWQSPLYQDHVLTGSIWLSAESRFIDADTLTDLLAQQDILLLGEKHDNPDHHRLRLQLLNSLLEDTAGATVLALEMVERGRQPALDALDETVGEADLPDALSWDTEGWPWEFYGPVVRLAQQTNTAMQAGNINRDDVMQIYSNAADSEPVQPLNQEQLDQLYHDIDSSHCGMLPESQFPAMVRVQQARDQQMADALMAPVSGASRRILIAGNYHIRHDLGVPNYLSAAQLPATPMSIAFLEVNPEIEDPQAYLQRFSRQNAYDVIWFTPAVRADDYCADMAGGNASSINASSSRSDN